MNGKVEEDVEVLEVVVVARQEVSDGVEASLAVVEAKDLKILMTIDRGQAGGWNASEKQKDDVDPENQEVNMNQVNDINMRDMTNQGKKRLALNSNLVVVPGAENAGAIVPTGGSSKVASMIGMFDPDGMDPLATPQKNAKKKKQKVEDGEALDKSNTRSAASLEDDCREQ